jgi:hypothetical protein
VHKAVHKQYITPVHKAVHKQYITPVHKAVQGSTRYTLPPPRCQPGPALLVRRSSSSAAPAPRHSRPQQHCAGPAAGSQPAAAGTALPSCWREPHPWTGRRCPCRPRLAPPASVAGTGSHRSWP